MKKTLYVLAFIATSLYANTQNTDNWYKVFTGKAGNLQTTLHLHKSGKNYNGYVWFEQNQTPMQLYGGFPVAKSDSIQISASNGTVSFLMTGIFSGTGFSGISQLEKQGSPAKKAGFQLQVSNEKDFTPFMYYAAIGKDSMPPAYKNYSQLEYFLSSIWPSGNGPLDESIKKTIRTFLNMKIATVETGKYILEQKNKTVKGWKAEYMKLSPRETADLGMSLSHREEDNTLVMHENEKLITLAHYFFLEAGGQAHGNYSTSVITINKQNSKPLQLSDVLTPQGINVLPSILEQVARIMYGARNNKPLDQNDFMVKKILPTKNMFVTGSGIGFVYPPYELRSFADGEITLMVPFAAVKPYLLPGYQ